MVFAAKNITLMAYVYVQENSFLANLLILFAYVTAKQVLLRLVLEFFAENTLYKQKN